MKTRIYIITGLLSVLPFLLCAQIPFHDGTTDNLYELGVKARQHFDQVGTGRGTGYKQYMRFESFMEPRVYPSGQITNYGARIWNEAMQYELELDPAFKSGSVTGANWTQIVGSDYSEAVEGVAGSSPGTGRLNCIAFDPADSSNIFVGSAAGGLWKTTNNGSTWTALTDGMPILAVNAVAIHPTNSDIIYMLTGDADDRRFYSKGVFKSLDGGDSWYSTGLSWDNSDAQLAYDLKIHPRNPDTVICVTSKGVYTSTNGGSTWPKTEPGYFFDIEFHPTKPDTVYTGMHDSLYRSVNGGLTWSSVYVSAGNSSCTDCRMELAVTPAEPNAVFFIRGKWSVGQLDVKKSADAGATWPVGTLFPVSNGSENIIGYKGSVVPSSSQARYNLGFAVHPGNSSILYLGGTILRRSANGGSVWSITANWDFNNLIAGESYVHADIHSLEFNGASIYACSDGGLFRATKVDGSNWAFISKGIDNSQSYAMDISTLDSSLIYIGTQDNGLNRMNHDGKLYHEVCCDAMGVQVSRADMDDVYAVLSSGSFYYTSDGTNWSSYNPPSSAGGLWVRPLHINRNDNSYLYFGNDDLIRTTTPTVSGSWVDINANTSATQDIRTIESATSDKDRMYVTISNSHNQTPIHWSIYNPPPADIVKRTDKATSAIVNSGDWTVITNTLPVATVRISDIIVDENRKKWLWVTCSGFSAANKVFRSTDSGDNWTNMSTGLPNVPVNTIVQGDTVKHSLYVGTDIGVFYIDDDLSEWIPFRNGMPNAVVTDLDINKSINRIYASTYGRGVWKSPIIDECLDTLILTNGNNPSNPNSPGYEFHEAADLIESTRLIAANADTTVPGFSGITYVSPEIRLKDGFHAKTNSTFFAKNDTCKVVAPAIPRIMSGTYAGPLPGASVQLPSYEEWSSKDYFELSCYPNPTAGNTTIEFRSKESAACSMYVYDVLGREKDQIFENELLLNSNQYILNYSWDKLKPGIYFLTLLSGNQQSVVKVIKTQ